MEHTRNEPEDHWTEVIKPERGWFEIRFKELWAYRDLILMFVNRDFISVYKQTLLGPAWFFLQPLLTTLVFVVIFGNFVGIPTDGNPQILFYLSGVTVWQYFSSCLNKTSSTFISNSGIFGKVYFPRLVIPVANVIGSLISFFIQFLLFLLILCIYKATGANIHPNLYILLTPFLLLLMAAFALGMGLLISSMTIRYRDLNFLVAFGVQLLMYATPVIYPLSIFPVNYQGLIITLNPMATIVECFRFAFLGTGTVNFEYLAQSTFTILLILATGILVFNKAERTFIDKI